MTDLALACPVRVFLAASDHTADERSRLAELAEVVKAAGHQVVAGEGVEGVRGSDALVALLDGANPEADVAFLLGVARERGIPTLGLRNDARAPAGGTQAGLYLHLSAFAHGDWKTLEGALFEFLTRFPTRESEVLVRDRVPTRLRQEGVTFDVRRVDGGERVRALKRHAVLEAQRLVAAVEGDERDHLAELLEIVETILEARHYDPAGVKRIKDRLENDDGAYTQGYMVRR